MAIDRGPWNALVDDDGSNLIGSIWNKDAIKTVILDPVDAALPPAAPAIASGLWTPTDASGAGLVFSVVTAQTRYWKFDKLVIITAYLTYPATANGANAIIGGLPFNNGAGYGALYTGQSPVPNTYLIIPNTITFFVCNATSGAVRTNAQLTGAAIIVTGMYLTN